MVNSNLTSARISSKNNESEDNFERQVDYINKSGKKKQSANSSLAAISPSPVKKQRHVSAHSKSSKNTTQIARQISSQRQSHKISSASS